MKLTNCILLCFLGLTIALNAQETTSNEIQEPVKALGIDEGTINNQFDYIIKKSYSYKDFKNVKLTWIYRLKKAVDDSLNLTKKTLANTEKTLKSRETEIASLTESMEISKNEISSLNNEKDSIQLLGLSTSKPLYNTILWSSIGGLLVFLIVYIIRFNRSNSITKESKIKFDELEIEFDNYRQRSLEREQQLRRKLQDEINKQRKEK